MDNVAVRGRGSPAAGSTRVCSGSTTASPLSERGVATRTSCPTDHAVSARRSMREAGDDDEELRAQVAAHGRARGRPSLRDLRRAARARDRCLLTSEWMRRALELARGVPRSTATSRSAPSWSATTRRSRPPANERELARRPHRARGDPGAARRRRGRRDLAARRLHALRDAGAVRDVRRRDRARAARPCRVRGGRSEGGLRGIAREPRAGSRGSTTTATLDAGVLAEECGDLLRAVLPGAALAAR